MVRPQTLLELAGAKPRPHRLYDSAVVMIDFQREYVDGQLALPGAQPALAAASRLLQSARAEGAAVIHVVHRGKSGGLFDPDTAMFEFAEEASPAADEDVVTKNLPNAFTGTDLLSRLHALRTRSLIIAGFMTHMCVSSTVRAALDLGFGCTVVANACATRPLPLHGGGVIGANELHEAELAALADRFAAVVDRPEELAS